MIIQSAKFISSNTELNKCPKPDRAEFAFIGRSNVGKSSLINMLCDRNNLALTSSSPGKTRLINHFLINDEWYLVDLPGYGYAKVSKSLREEWEKMIKKYFSRRQSLLNTFILVDLRVPPQESDLNLIRWFGMNSLPFTIVMTKADKLSKRALPIQLEKFQLKLQEDWDELPLIITASSKTKRGKKEILNNISEILPVFKKPR